MEERDQEEQLERELKIDITKGNVLKNVLYMGIPSMIGFGAMTIYALTDIYWVGRLGMSHVAALTMFGSIAWILGSTNQIVGTGSVALISRRYGEREYEATRDVIRQPLLLPFSLAAIMAVLKQKVINDLERMEIGRAAEYARGGKLDRQVIKHKEKMKDHRRNTIAQ